MGQFFGDPGPTELPPNISHDPRAGYVIERRWRCSPTVSADLINGFSVGGISLNGQKWTLDPGSEEGGYKIISVNISSQNPDGTSNPDQPLSDIWEFDTNDLEKDVWGHPDLLRIFNAAGLDRSQFAIWKIEVEKFFKGVTDDPDVPDNQDALVSVSLPTVTGNDAVLLGYFLDDIADGVTSYLVPQFVLRNTKIVTSSGRIKAAIGNTDILVTTPTLISVYEVPETIKVDMTLPELADGSWLIRGPKVRQVTSDKWSLMTEFWHADDYSKFQYDPPI